MRTPHVTYPPARTDLNARQLQTDARNMAETIKTTIADPSDRMRCLNLLAVTLRTALEYAAC